MFRQYGIHGWLNFRGLKRNMCGSMYDFKLGDLLFVGETTAQITVVVKFEVV